MCHSGSVILCLNVPIERAVIVNKMEIFIGLDTSIVVN